MSVLDRIRTLHSATATASAAWALLVGGIIVVFALNLLLFDPCIAPDGQHYGICDPPQPPNAAVWAVLIFLLLAAVANFWKGWRWPLLGAWLLMLCLSLADTVLFLIPSVRESVGVHGDPEIGKLFAAQLSQPIFLACVLGLLLAVLAVIAARRRREN